MAKAELGIKRVCPVTGRKFYDLNRDPIVSPYTGQAYPRGFFEPHAKVASNDDDEEEVDVAAPELVALEEADAGDSTQKEAVVVEDIDEDIGADENDDTFLEEEEDEDNDVAGLIDGDIVDDEEA